MRKEEKQNKEVWMNASFGAEMNRRSEAYEAWNVEVSTLEEMEENARKTYWAGKSVGRPSGQIDNWML